MRNWSRLVARNAVSAQAAALDGWQKVLNYWLMMYYTSKWRGNYPVRQWILSLPIPLRLLLARYPKQLSKVMQVVHRAISTDIIRRAGHLKKPAKTGAVTYIQRFGISLNLNIHFHMLFVEGVITEVCGQTKFKRVKAPNHNDVV